MSLMVQAGGHYSHIMVNVTAFGQTFVLSFFKNRSIFYIFSVIFLFDFFTWKSQHIWNVSGKLGALEILQGILSIRVVNRWNSLDQQTVDAPNLNAFKANCCSLWRPLAENSKQQFEEDSSSCCPNVTENLVSYLWLF